MADKFTKGDLAAVNARFKMLTFYPSDPQAQAAILELLAEMVPSREALDWLMKTMVNQVGTWKGPAELRGILCTKFKPADGVEMYATSPGFSPADNEQRYIEQHEERMRIEKAAPPPLALLEAFNRKPPTKRVQ